MPQKLRHNRNNLVAFHEAGKLFFQKGVLPWAGFRQILSPPVGKIIALFEFSDSLPCKELYFTSFQVYLLLQMSDHEKLLHKSIG